MAASQRQADRSPVHRIVYWLGRIVLATLLLATLILVAVFSFEQTTLKPLLERITESATGRALSIEGELDAVAGRTITLRAGDIRLANADWADPQPMLHVEQLEVSVDLRRLLRGTTAIDSLVIDGAQLRVERNSGGRSNWALGTDEPPPDSAPRAPVTDTKPPLQVLPIIRSQLSAIDVTVVDPALAEPLLLRFTLIEHHAERQETLQASIVGQVKQRPFTVDARVEPISGLLSAGAIQLDVQAASRSVRFDLEGEVDSLAAPQQATAHLSLSASDIAQVLATLGLPPLASGATELNASLLPSANQHTLDLSAAVAGLQLDAQARLQSLVSIDGASATLSANGKNLAAIGRLAGLEGLPVQPYSLSSGVTLAGNRLTLGQTQFDSGNFQLRAQGSMAQFPALEGSNLTLQLAGRNYVELVRLMGPQDLSRLRPEPFNLSAELEYTESQQQRFNAELTLADVKGRFDGNLIGYPDLVGSELAYRLSGQNSALLQQWLGQPTGIEGDYTLTGKVLRSDSGFDIDRADLTLGTNELKLSGTVGNQPLLGDTELSLQFRGPDLEQITRLAGYDGFVPDGDADIVAVTSVTDHRAAIGNLEARLGRNRLQASGQVNLRDALSGSQIEVTASGKDIADVVPPALKDYIDTGQTFDVTGRLATDGGRLNIGALQARLGEVRLKASGSLAAQQPLADTKLSFELEGPDLKAFMPDNLVAYEFPAQTFTVNGGIALTDDALGLEAITARIGEDRLTVAGTLPLDTPTEGLALTISASGPNLATVIPVETTRLDFAELSYDLSAEVAIGSGELTLRALAFSTPRGHLAGDVSVALDDPLDTGRFDLRAKGENLAEFAPATPHYQPAAVKFALDARGNWDARTLTIDAGQLALGSARMEASGTVSLPPDAVASQLTLSAGGDNLSDLGQIRGLVLPNEAFSIDASLRGDAQSLEIPELVARLGDSDLTGSLQVGFAEKPDLVIHLESEVLNLAALLPPDDETKQTEATPEPSAGDGRVIPQLRVPAEQLHAINLDADIDLGELRLKRNDLHEVRFDATLKDGHLEVRRLNAIATEGQLSARFEAIAEGERISTRGELIGREIVLGKAKSQDPAISLPKQDLQLGFETQGATTRELAANLHGFAQLTGGDGRLQNSRALSLFGSFFEELLGTINPFVKKEPYTTISCYAAYAEIIDGVAVIKPGAVMQTDKLDMYAHGQIDLNSEKIALRFDTSARSGIGISVADFVNPFVGVSGTLARPRLGIDPENAMFEGSFAYATGGLSIVAKSLFSRWFGTRDPCGSLQQQALEYQQEKEAAEAAAARQEEAVQAE